MKHGFAFIATILVALLLTLLVGECSQGQTVRYYTAAWCGPCQQIKPQVEALRAQGLPIEIVSVDNGAPAGITSIPAFQLIDANGRVAKQWVGTLNEGEIRAWVQRQQPAEQQGEWTHGGMVPPANIQMETTNHGNAQPTKFDVRVLWRDGFGTGTVIKLEDGTIGVLTCEHVIRGTEYARLTNGEGKTVVGRVLISDAEADIAVLSSDPSWQWVAIGDDVPMGTPVQFRGFSLGGGLRKFYGTTSASFTDGCVEANGTPAMQGDSGGGVFSKGQLVGVLNSASENSTVFQPIGTIKRILSQKRCRPCVPQQQYQPQQYQQSAAPQPAQSSCNCVVKFQQILARMDAQDKKIESLSNFQCPTPEPGPPGPAGPAGPQGIQGEQGPPGKDANTTNLEQRIAELENRKIKLEIYRDGELVGVSEGKSIVRVNIKQLEESLQNQED